MWPGCFTNEDDIVRVIIETPKDSRNKFAYDEEIGLFKLRKVLPAGMRFPLDMGFLPTTRGDDGDPLDVLVLMDELSYPGCLVECRIIGAVKVMQKESGGEERNDRFIAVPKDMRDYEDIQDIKDLNKNFLEELLIFLESYNKFEEANVVGTSIIGASGALKLIKKQLV